MAEPPDDSVDGEVLPPGEGEGGKGASKNHRTYGRTSQQTPEQREQEERQARPFRDVMVVGLDWRRPGWEPTDEQRQMVSMLKFSGYTDEDVARVLDMSVETLQRYFEWELANARMMIVGDLATRAVVRARQGDATLTMFLLKTRGNSNFSERAVQIGALTEGLKANEPDDKKRAELVGKVLDLLDTHRKTKTKTADTATKKGTT